MRTAAREVLEAQVAAGIDVVSDSAVGKAGFVNDVKGRFAGFDQSGEPSLPMLATDYPEIAPVVFGGASTRPINTPACTAAVAYRDRQPLDDNLANLRAGLEGVGVEEAFICAPSPACVAQVQANQH